MTVTVGTQRTAACVQQQEIQEVLHESRSAPLTRKCASRGLMELDTDKIDQAILALLALGRHEGNRAWKAFDWESMARLHAKGHITDPVNKAKSVLFTEDGARESQRLLEDLFGRHPDRNAS